MTAQPGIPAFVNGLEEASDRPTGNVGDVEFEFVVPLTVFSAMTASVFSVVSGESVKRRRVAERFARFASNIRGVEEVWLDSTVPELQVSVVLRAFDFDRE